MSQVHFGKLVKARRKGLKLTQVELAETCKVTQGTISKLEHGMAPVDLEVAARACELLGIGPAKAFDEILK